MKVSFYCPAVRYLLDFNERPACVLMCLKQVLLMWMAASVNYKDFDFYSHGVIEEKEAHTLQELVNLVNKNECAVSDLYIALAELSGSLIPKCQLFPFLIEFFEKEFGKVDPDEI